MPIIGQGTGSHHRLKRHCPHGHPYDEENTVRRNDGSRRCRRCEQARGRRRYREIHGPPSARLKPATPKEHCRHGHPMTPENTMFYQGQRNCRVCHRERNRLRYHRIKERLAAGKANR